MTSPIDFYTSHIKGFESMSFEERRKAVNSCDIESVKNKFHNKTTLKDIFRVKPRKDAVSEYSYKNFVGTHISCFRLEQCQPMRNPPNKPRTAKQQEQATKLATLAKGNSSQGKAKALAQQAISEEWLCLDTETTDLDGVVIELCIVNCKTKQVLFNSRIHTDAPISPHAEKVHGISYQNLIGQPSISDVQFEINSIMGNTPWVAFNKSFDLSILRQSYDREGCDLPMWLSNPTGSCAMRKLAVPFFGSSNSRGTISLADSLECAGIEFKGNAHSAMADTLAVVDLIHHIANT